MYQLQFGFVAGVLQSSEKLGYGLTNPSGSVLPYVLETVRHGGSHSFENMLAEISDLGQVVDKKGSEIYVNIPSDNLFRFSRLLSDRRGQIIRASPRASDSSLRF